MRVKDVYWEPEVKVGCPVCGKELTLSISGDTKSMHSGKKLCSIFSPYHAKCPKCGLNLNITAALDVINSEQLPYWEKARTESNRFSTDVLNLNERRLATGGVAR